MPSPFPGMDPYLEPFWGDVHTRLVLYSCDQLQGRLPGDLRARVQERVFVDAPAEDERNVYPDVRVVERGRGDAATATAVAPIDVHVTKPVVVETGEPITERCVEIIDVGSGRQVVTVVEILSPANKRPGTSRNLYLKKQRELIDGGVSLVEIDLLREGASTVSVLPRHLAKAHRTPYYVVARRGHAPDKAEVYPFDLADRLPKFEVPLRQGDPVAILDLQAVLDLAYDNGGYRDDLDYEAEPVPAFRGEAAAWADALLRQKGVRRREPAPAPRKRRKKDA